MLSLDCVGLADAEKVGVADETVGVVGGEDMARVDERESAIREFSDKC